jgi:hypothetical protein
MILATLFFLSLPAQAVPQIWPISWKNPLDFTADTTNPCNPYLSTAHNLTPQQFQKSMHRMCEIWGRASLQSRVCGVPITNNAVEGFNPLDFVSSGGFPSYSMSLLGSIASFNWYAPPNLNGDVSWFCDTDTPPKRWLTCERNSGYPRQGFCSSNTDCYDGQDCQLSVCTDNTQCPSGQCNAGACALGVCSDLCPDGLVFDGEGATDPGRLNFQTVGLHEIGHSQGLDHPIASDPCGGGACTVNANCPSGSTCVGGVCNATVRCPVMTSGLRDAHYPTRDDTATIRTGREISIRYADIDSSGSLLAPSGGCTFGVSNTYTAPKIACRPSTASSSCVVSWRSSTNANARFSFVTVRLATS